MKNPENLMNKPYLSERVTGLYWTLLEVVEQRNPFAIIGANAEGTAGEHYCKVECIPLEEVKPRFKRYSDLLKYKRDYPSACQLRQSYLAEKAEQETRELERAATENPSDDTRKALYAHYMKRFQGEHAQVFEDDTPF